MLRQFVGSEPSGFGSRQMYQSALGFVRDFRDSWNQAF
jgi:hypothetical protein